MRGHYQRVLGAEADIKMNIKDLYRGEVILYKDKVEVRLDQETVWLTQKQMSELFDTERSVITKHINNIIRTGELEQKSVCANFARTAEDGKAVVSFFVKTERYGLTTMRWLR